MIESKPRRTLPEIRACGSVAAGHLRAIAKKVDCGGFRKHVIHTAALGLSSIVSGSQQFLWTTHHSVSSTASRMAQIVENGEGALSAR